MNQDVFHNQIALSLGYKRILQDKQINISIDDKEDADNPIVRIDVLDGKLKFTYNASQNTEDIGRTILLEQKEMIKAHALEDEIKFIIDSTHQAFLKATTAII